jgi:hypothetical protein
MPEGKSEGSLLGTLDADGMTEGSFEMLGNPEGNSDGEELGSPVGPVGLAVRVGANEGVGVGCSVYVGWGVFVGAEEG